MDPKIKEQNNFNRGMNVQKRSQNKVQEHIYYEFFQQNLALFIIQYLTEECFWSIHSLSKVHKFYKPKKNM